MAQCLVGALSSVSSVTRCSGHSGPRRSLISPPVFPDLVCMPQEHQVARWPVEEQCQRAHGSLGWHKAQSLVTPPHRKPLEHAALAQTPAAASTHTTDASFPGVLARPPPNLFAMRAASLAHVV